MKTTGVPTRSAGQRERAASFYSTSMSGRFVIGNPRGRNSKLAETNLCRTRLSLPVGMSDICPIDGRFAYPVHTVTAKHFAQDIKFSISLVCLFGSEVMEYVWVHLIGFYGAQF